MITLTKEEMVAYQSLCGNLNLSLLEGLLFTDDTMTKAKANDYMHSIAGLYEKIDKELSPE